MRLAACFVPLAATCTNPAPKVAACLTDANCLRARSGPHCSRPLNGCVACLTDANCSGGRCDVAQHQCVACLADPDCAVGQVCRRGSCLPGCNASQPFPSGLYCDLTQDVCVACLTDDDCPIGQRCGAQHSCVPGCDSPGRCPTGQGCCGGLCTLLDSNSDCGACGNACAFPNARAACIGSACRITSCAPGWADCNGDPTDGCEEDTASDPANCGRCGSACRPPATSCAGGSCTCPGGQLLCSGACTDTDSDAKNCGGCGMVCPPLSACVRGACTCTGGTATCDGALLSEPLSGGSINILATASQANSPGYLAVDASSLYWTGGKGEVMSLPIGGGQAPTVLGVGRIGTAGLALDGTNVYWTEDYVGGGVYRAAK